MIRIVLSKGVMRDTLQGMVEGWSLRRGYNGE